MWRRRVGDAPRARFAFWLLVAASTRMFTGHNFSRDPAPHIVASNNSCTSANIPDAVVEFGDFGEFGSIWTNCWAVPTNFHGVSRCWNVDKLGVDIDRTCCDFDHHLSNLAKRAKNKCFRRGELESSWSNSGSPCAGKQVGRFIF